MSDLKIEKDVPVTENRSRKYPWREMEPGDSFRVEEYTTSGMRALSSAGRAWCKRNAPHLKCVVRKDGDGIRVWLVEREEE